MGTLEQEDGAHRRQIRSTGSALLPVLRLAGPNSFSMVLDMLNEVTNMMILGRSSLDPSVLAAVGLGNMMQNVFGLAVATGLANAFDTLVSQAYGAGEHEQCIFWLQRGRAIITAQLLWIMPLLYFSGEILLGLGLPRDVAKYAGEYNRHALIGLWAYFQYEAYAQFLHNCSHVTAQAVVTLICSVLHIGWCWYFVNVQGLGNAGAGLANSTTWILKMILITISFFCLPEHRSRCRGILGVSQAAFREWGTYLSVGLPALFQVCCDWWFWEITSLMVGYLGADALAAHTSVTNVLGIIIMAPLALNFANGTLVGQAVGKNDEQEAMRVAAACLAITVCYGVIVVMLILVFRSSIAEMYTRVPSIQHTIKTLLTIYAGMVALFDFMQLACAGAFKGLGQQNKIAIVYLFTYYGLMVPLSYILAFPMALGVAGVWYGMALGGVTQLSLFVVLMRRVRFETVVLEAHARIELTSGLEDNQPAICSMERVI